MCDCLGSCSACAGDWDGGVVENLFEYVDLMRIKAHETGENKELDYQIKVAKVKLSSFGIDYSELEFSNYIIIYYTEQGIVGKCSLPAIYWADIS